LIQKPDIEASPPALMTVSTMQWAKRLTGVSVLLLLIGVVSYYFAMPAMFEELDPAQNNMLELGPGEDGQVEIEDLGEYVALRLEGENDADLRLVNSDGQVDTGSKPSAIDITRTGEDGTLYVPVRVFRSSAAGEYTLFNDGETTLWLVDDVSAQSALFTKPWFVVMTVGCCLGPVFGVVGLILALIGWGSRGKENVPVVLDTQGRLPTTDELYRQYHNMEVEPENDVPDPFADTGQTESSESEDREESSSEESGHDWKGWDEG